MMLERDPRSAAEKIRLFRARFRGLEHVYGTYDPDSGRSWQVKKPVKDEVVLNHLRGLKPFGVYLLTGTHTRAVVVDYDDDTPEPPMEFWNHAAHYGLVSYIESSKSKGFHAWVFFDGEGVPAVKARAVARHILEETGYAAEVFPKQDSIDLSRGEYGNFINLPLFGRLAVEGRTVFLDPSNGLRPVANQWKYLEDVVCVSESLLDEIIEVNEIEIGCPKDSTADLVLGTIEQGWGLPPCARRMLAEGVTDNQRLSCFRLAVHLKRQGIPLDIAIAALSEWTKKNRPTAGKRVLTETEVKTQTSDAFKKDYKGCGCDDPAIAPFCEPGCPIAPKATIARLVSSTKKAGCLAPHR